MTSYSSMTAARRFLLLHAADEGYGSDRVILSIAKNLRREGAEVRVLLPDDTPPGWLTEQLKSEGIDVRRGPLGVARRRYFNRKEMPQYLTGLFQAKHFVERQIRDFDADIVHVNTSALVVGALLSRQRRWALIWHIHEIIEHPRWMAEIFCRLPFLADRVIVVSEAVRHNLCRNRRREVRTLLLRNGIARRTEVAKPALPPMRICYAGRISEWKGYRVFLKAAIEIAGEHNDVEFVLAGDTLPGEQWRLREIEHAIANHGLQHRITVLGFHEDIPALFDSVHAVVVPSVLPDPLPTVVLEGMRSGAVVISTAHGGAVEMIEDGISGYLVEPGNPQDLKRTLLRLLTAPHLIEKIGTAASRRVNVEFTTTVFWQNLRSIYEDSLALSDSRQERV